MLKPLIRLIIVAATLAALAPTAEAADPGFCRDYARAALNQVEMALSTSQVRTFLSVVPIALDVERAGCRTTHNAPTLTSTPRLPQPRPSSPE